MKKALVLSGGSIKGAFQAGAIAYVLDRGFTPDLLCGISVGSLNAAFLADRAGRAKIKRQDPDWPKIGLELEEFWRTRITKPDDLVETQSKIKLAWKVFWNQFDCIIKTSPFTKLVYKEIKLENIHASPVKLRVGAVNLVTGEIVYADESSPRIVDYVVASTAEPITMSLVDVEGKPFYDGGLRDIAPLSHVLDLGVSEIVCIVCQAEKVEEKEFNRGKLLHLIGRILDIVTNEILANDLRHIQRLRDFLKRLPKELIPNDLAPYADPKITLIRPDEPIPVQVDSFTEDDIRKMLQLGRETASHNYPVYL